MVVRLVVGFTQRAVDAVAFTWNRRAELLEVAGATCLVVAGTSVATALGWAVAGTALLVKAVALDRRRSAPE